MRRAAKTDQHSRQLDAAAERVGASVLKLDAVGKGCPDRVLGFRGANYLVEYKSDPKVTRRKPKQLTPDQVKFHGAWRGAPVLTVETEDELLRAIGATR